MRLLATVFMMLSVPALAQRAEPGVTYVFFNWGDGELSGDAKAALDRVAAQYATSQGQLLVDGHSDRSGPDSANLRSSRERANVVRDYLVAKGVSSTAVRVRAYGEQRPLIATEDGVREVQNRRVEVRFVTP